MLAKFQGIVAGLWAQIRVIIAIMNPGSCLYIHTSIFIDLLALIYSKQELLFSQLIPLEKKGRKKGKGLRGNFHL